MQNTLADFYYTNAVEDINSSAVDGVFYNAQTNELVVSLRESESAYLYTGVPRWTYDTMVSSPSVGRYYATVIKVAFGPGKNLGWTINLDFKNVDEEDKQTVGTPKGLTYASDAQVTSTVEAFPLTSVAGGSISASSTPSGKTRKHDVIFSSNGERSFTVEAASVDAAVAELDKVAQMLGLHFPVKRVVVHFE